MLDAWKGEFGHEKPRKMNHKLPFSSLDEMKANFLPLHFLCSRKRFLIDENLSLSLVHYFGPTETAMPHQSQ